jgi:hypothetical protein
VTVLFADLKASMELIADRDPEDARNLLDSVIDRMMKSVHYYEGTVNHVMGDGIMALLPLILALLSYLRIVKVSFLTRNRRYVILLIAILSAVLTPTPDFFNMALMGGPL